MSIPIRDLPVVIGANAKRLRKDAGLTLDTVSIAARRRGLKWSTSRVADFEAGRVSPNLATLTAYAFALADAGCRDLTLSDLVESSTNIRINDAMNLHMTDLHDVMAGEPIASKLGPRSFIGPIRLKIGDQTFTLADDAEDDEAERVSSYLKRTDRETINSIMSNSGSTEERIQRTLRISPPLLAAVSGALWGRSFSDERNARAGANANAQKRGQITRQLQAELKAELDHGDD